jgi:hypothetical protein
MMLLELFFPYYRSNMSLFGGSKLPLMLKFKSQGLDQGPRVTEVIVGSHINGFDLLLVVHILLVGLEKPTYYQ